METTLSTNTAHRGPGLLRLIAAAIGARRQRRALGQLDMHLLRDIGIDELAQIEEAARPVWDVPKAWRG